MTPDFLAGLLIGSMLVYACWLLSLRLEQRESQHPVVDADFDTASRSDSVFDIPGKAHILPRPKGPRPAPATQPPDPVLAALLVLGEELDD